MTMLQFLFYLMAFISVGSALFVAYSKNLVRSIFMFFVTLFALAGLYVLALADFVAITQIVIYVGGILVLMLFGFMLSGREALSALVPQKKSLVSINKLAAVGVAALFFVVLYNLIQKAKPDSLNWVNEAMANQNVISANTNITQNIGINLMTRYLLPFEAVSILLLMALVGAAHLSRREEGIV